MGCSGISSPCPASGLQWLFLRAAPWFCMGAPPHGQWVEQDSKAGVPRFDPELCLKLPAPVAFPFYVPHFAHLG